MKMCEKRRIFLDFDGVISDSNHAKERNIAEAYFNIFGVNNDEFVNYFTSNNGLPRESKLNFYFGDADIENKLLKEYERLNSSLLFQDLTAGLKEFLAYYSDERLMVLSGGDKHEIERYLRKNGLYNVFENIFAGPQTKSQHLGVLGVNSGDIFIGDSRHDYEVAKKHGIKFVFLYKYSQEKLPLDFIDKSVEIFSDFEDLIKSEKWKIEK